MAGPNDPFTPGPSADPTAGIPNYDTFENLRNQWTTFLDQPGARTALLQTGLALMSPGGFGQTAAGHIAGAIGQGAEAATRGELTQQKLAESESKSQLAEARAQTAAQTANVAAQKIPLAYFQRQSIEQGQKGREAIGALTRYQTERKTAQQGWQKQKEQANLGLGPDPGPFQDLTFEQWARENGMISLPGVREAVAASGKSGAKPQAPQEDQSGE